MTDERTTDERTTDERTTDERTTAEWTAAIHDDRLAEIDHPVPTAACAAIGNRMTSELKAITTWLSDAGVTADVTDDAFAGSPRQRHAAEIRVADAATATAAAAVLAEQGFTVWEPTQGAAGEIQRRCRSVLTVARTSDVTVAVRLRWPEPQRRLPSGLVPNQADAAFAPLPAAAWPLAFVLRPVRLALERLGLRRRATPVLGPFLSTPADVLPALLDFANVASDDTVADLGCGDGRILIEAVKRSGCRAIGVESDPALVLVARERCRAAGVADRVRIVEGDALSAELGQATTVFVFLPADAAVDLVEALLSSLTPGTRVIAHEQHRLPRSIPGAETRAIIVGEGVTVAHQWIAGR